MRTRATTSSDRAQLLTRKRHWDEAEAAWSEVAASAERIGDTDDRRQALVAAGDAAFRADRPVLALRHLSAARQACDPRTPLWSLLGVQVAGILVETGDLQASQAVFAEVDQDGIPPQVRAVLLDTRIGLHLAAGRIRDARTDLTALRRVGEIDAEAAILFREGQVDRVEGRFGEATESLASAVVRIQGEPRFDGPLGAILLELAEVAVFREDFDDATSLLDEAEAAWCRARRRSGVFRTEAARMRLAACMGTGDLVTTNLERAITFAAQRELRLLEAELRLARGLCLLPRDQREAVIQLDRVMELAFAAGAPHLAGQARLALHDRPDGSVEELELACGELMETPPWRSRAFLAIARARARGRDGRDLALGIASTAFCRFSAMDLPADEARARTLLWQLARREEEA
jgi:hypothetical protein